jgi:hypothetical protein
MALEQGSTSVRSVNVRVSRQINGPSRVHCAA